MNKQKLMAELDRDEGRRKRIYLDTASPPKWTGGVGRNLTDRGFSDDEIDLMLANDIKTVEFDLDCNLPWWRLMSEPRQRVLANMCFNLGIVRLLKFKHALASMAQGRFGDAATEMLASVWATQVGDRAKRLAKIMKTGVEP